MAAEAVEGIRSSSSVEATTTSSSLTATAATTKTDMSSILSSYIGLSFAVFLGFLPRDSLSYVSSLQSRHRILSLKLFQSEDELGRLRNRRREDSKANARVVEIFASHRNAWQQEEKRLLHRLNEANEKIASLAARITELERSEADLKDCADALRREVSERDVFIDLMSSKHKDDGAEAGGGEIQALKVRIGDLERSEDDLKTCVEALRGEVRERDYMLDFMSRKPDDVDGGEEELEETEVGVGSGDPVQSGRFGDYCRGLEGTGMPRSFDGLDPVPEMCFSERNAELDDMDSMYGQLNGYGRDFLVAPPVASKLWRDGSGGWQDVQYDSLESTCHTKNFVARRMSPWKVDGESTGVPSKLKLLEQELHNLEKVGKGDFSKVPSLMTKQAKRYQSLAGKIDDLCRRMQISDPCEPRLSSEFRTQRQMEFLLEAFRLQNRATETRQKLNTLEAEAAKSRVVDDAGGGGQASLITMRSLGSIRSYFREIQRNLEVWLARIMGDLEGNLAREGGSHIRDYYSSRNPFVR